MRTTFYTYLIGMMALLSSLSISSQSTCPPLTPFCQDLNTTFMPGACMVEVWAKDFISKINDSQTDIDDFTISFDEDATVMNLIFFSEDGNIRNVSIWITDSCGVQTRCDVILRIRDNTGVCSQGCIDSQFTGWSVTTCTAPFGSGGTTGVIYDTRNNQSEAPKGCDWVDLPEIRPANWNIDSIRQVFGVAIDEFDNIYLGASDVYKTNYTPINGLSRGQIFKCEAPSFRAVPFVALPTGQGELNGIGNLAYNSKNNLLYASNLEDGNIYRIDLDGNIIDSFDPFNVDDGAAGVAPQEEQIWGVQFNIEGDDCKLYFARLSDTERTMYSIDLNVDGSFPPAAETKVEIQNLPGERSRITDIAFSKDGNLMITAERGTNFIPGTGERGPHEAQVNRYQQVGGAWINEKQLFVGELLNTTFNSGENSAGGVDFGYRQIGSDPLAQCDSLVWATANLMRLPKAVPGTGLPFILYGMEGIPTSGNVQFSAGDTLSNVYCDLFKDFDGVYTDPNQDLGLDLDDKARIGDVEVFRCPVSPTVNSTVSTFDVSGSISTPIGMMMDNIDINISAPDMEDQKETNNGYYLFSDLSSGNQYTLRPSKNDDITNGVSTLDLIKIQRHVLGVDKLDDASSLIAADIDGSGEVSGVDLVALRKLILGKSDSFEKNTSWRFVPKASLQIETNVNLLDDQILVSREDADLQHNDFVGIKIGDVDHSNNYNPFSTKRSSKIGSIETAGQSATVSVSLNNELSGFYFEFNLSDSDLISLIRLNGEAISNDHYNISEGKLKITSTQKIRETLELELVFENAMNDVNYFQNNSNLTIYNNEYTEFKVALKQSEVALEEDLIFAPNPVNNSISLSIDMKIKGEIDLDVYGINGVEIGSYNASLAKGRNVINIDVSNLGMYSSGMYLIKTTTPTSISFNKIIKN